MKNKKCEKCNKNMKTLYIRDYYKGTSFLDVKPYYKSITKQKWKSIGLICKNNKCLNIEITDDILDFYWNRKQEKLKQKEIAFRELECKFAKYKFDNRKNIYSEKEKNNEIKINNIFFMNKFHKIISAISTKDYLKGLNKGYKDCNKNWNEKYNREKLTDEQILRKAEIILLERKLKLK